MKLHIAIFMRQLTTYIETYCIDFSKIYSNHSPQKNKVLHFILCYYFPLVI